MNDLKNVKIKNNIGILGGACDDGMDWNNISLPSLSN
jgi:hypothetical protein